MERLAVLRSRLESLSQLREVVAALRSLAAARMLQAAEALPGARRYAEIIGAALSQALLLSDGPPYSRKSERGRPAVLLCCGEHGFVGGFNDGLAEAALAELGPVGGLLFVIGSRGSLLAEERGRPADWATPAATHATGVPPLARRTAEEIWRRFAEGEIAGLTAVFGSFREGAHWELRREVLLPLDLSRFALPSGAGGAPFHTLPAGDLLSQLITENLLADMVRVVTENLAAENAARLQAMSAAYDNIGRKLETLAAEERTVRQEEITAEMLDVVNGAESVLNAG